MSIAKTLTVGLVSIAFVVTSFTATQNVGAQTVDELQGQLNALLAQLAALQAGSGATVVTAQPSVGSVVSTRGNAACPYTWTRNLSIGSSGDDVRQLQRFLNGNPQTRVAVSGVGSAGNETNYYGPATARAVSRFQEMYAAQILTPLGLSSGTGGFYTSTRKVANDNCRSARVVSQQPSAGTTVTQPAPTSATVAVRGSGLSVTAGNQPADAFAQAGALRIPYTVVVLTAGSQDVRVSGVRVRVDGLTDSDQFTGVALTDINGLLMGSTRSFNSRDEATVGGSFEVRANSSQTFVVVANVLTGDDPEFNGSGLGSISVVDVVTDAQVQGNFPITGASHAFTDAVNLPSVEVDVRSSDSEVELNRDAEVSVVDISLSGGNARDEGYLRSITLTQEGSADENEMGDITVLVDGDEVRANVVVYRDNYTIIFPGRGQVIEHSDDVEVTVEIHTSEGTGETVQFNVEDHDDVYVVGSRFGYGLPVEFGCGDDCEEMGTEAQISSGSITSGSRVRDFDDSISYGENLVLAVENFEFEGEGVEFEDLTFEVMLDNFDYTSTSDNSWETADVNEVTIDNLELYVNDRRVAYATDIVEFAEPSSDSSLTQDVEFADTFIVPAQEDNDVRFEIRADLDSSWADFDGSQLSFDLVDVGSAEGLISEDDYTNTNAIFDVSRSNPIRFEDVTIRGNEVNFFVTNENVDDTSYVAGSEDINFGSFEVDARDATDDVQLRNLFLTFSPETDSDLGDLDNCEIRDSNGDRVADSRSLRGTSASQARFTFDRNTAVERDSEEVFDVVCDISSRADNGDAYKLSVMADDHIEYEINRNDYEVSFEAQDLDVITVASAGSLRVSQDQPSSNDDNLFAVSTGGERLNDQSVIEVTLEAEQEDITVTDVYLYGVQVAGIANNANQADTREQMDKIVERVEVTLTGDTADSDEYVNAYTVQADFNNDGDTSDTGEELSLDRVLVFEDLDRDQNATIPQDTESSFTVDIDFARMGERRGVAGGWIWAEGIVVKYEGETSGNEGFVQRNFHDDFARALAYVSVPTVTTRSNDRIVSAGNDRKLYEFTVAASREGDVYLNQVAFSISKSDTGTTLSNLEVREGHSTLGNVSSPSGDTRVAFTSPEQISAGSSKTFSVYGDISGTWETDDNIVIDMLADDTRDQATVGQVWNANLGNFVWSPDTLEREEDTTNSNADWFNGWGLFENDDTDSVTVEK